MSRFLAISPGDDRPLGDWLRALAAAGVVDVLLREPTLASWAAEGLVRLALERGLQPWLHTKTPGAVELAGRYRVGVQLPDDGSAPPAGLRWGASCHDAAGVDRALGAGASYVTLSPVFPSPSKPGRATRPLGVDALCAIAGDRPVLALSGIDATRAQALYEAGAWGVAVLGALWEGPRPAPPRALRSLLPAAGVRPIHATDEPAR